MDDKSTPPEPTTVSMNAPTLNLSGTTVNLSGTTLNLSPRSVRPRIVILGGGFAGAYCAQEINRLLKKDEADVLLIDINNYFIFFPLLVEAGTGSLEPRHAVVAIRSFLGRGRFLMAEVQRIDFEKSAVYCRLPEEGDYEGEPGGEGDPSVREIHYDHLVLAVGSVTNLPPVPGVPENVMLVKNLADAIGLRDHAIRMLELADATPDDAARRAYLSWVVVGGNFSGIEVAGEFDAFLKRAAKEYPNLKPSDVHIAIIEREDHILGALGDRDLSLYALDRLRSRGVEVVLNTSVAEVGTGWVKLSDGRRIEARSVIWNAGIAVNPLVKRAPGLPLDKRGYILCDRDLRVQGMKNVWGIGDVAVNLDAAGNNYPATAQHALREGVHLGKNLAHVLRGEATTPCDLKNLGGLAAIGCRTGVAKIMGVKVSGMLAWFLWRTVYLFKMPGWSRRFRIALDWTADLFFRADYVQIGVHRRKKD